MTDSGLDSAAASLRAWLNTEHFTHLTAPEVTQFFTDSVTRWAHSLGYHTQQEVPIEALVTTRPGRPPRSGLLDIELTHRSGTGRRISIEIDRGSKRWSLDKLNRAAELGNLALWVRWSRQSEHTPIPPTVRLIRAHVIRLGKPGHHRYTLQTDNCG